ncbi:hypothetical protein NDU88_008185 [Pleurodeles waltl]|uniref:Uncharacterized protein n=1 Tax=Pleurodeles waltl TaxID=8319 RepID=A0AAV7PS57_PLEWA|nr:hypothetical protein NDU88_008185 [Pleurodeles waltl]
MKASFKAIEKRFEALTMLLGGMHERLNEHSTRFGAVEQRILDVEDGAMALIRCVERVEQLPKTMAEKNKDPEAPSQCNNICIMAMAKSTSTEPISTYIKQLLIELFGRNSFTVTFVVERVHRSLGPDPSFELLPA